MNPCEENMFKHSSSNVTVVKVFSVGQVHIRSLTCLAYLMLTRALSNFQCESPSHVGGSFRPRVLQQWRLQQELSHVAQIWGLKSFSAYLELDSPGGLVFTARTLTSHTHFFFQVVLSVDMIGNHIRQNSNT